MKKRILCILLTLCLSLTLLPALAFTLSDKGDIATNPATGTIYYGKTEGGDPALYRVVAKDANTITLFYNGANIASAAKPYDANTHDNWSGSDICLWLNGGSFLDNASVFTAAERAAIATYGTTETTNTTPLDYTIDISQKIVLPSVEEVKDSGTWDMNAAARTSGAVSFWWLRWPGIGAGDVATVGMSGNVVPTGVNVDQEGDVRPAFKLNLSSVLFTSAAAGGKSGSAGATLGAVSAPTGAQKLTIIDSSLSVGTVTATGQNLNAGTTVKVNVAGATPNKSVSAIITDSAGQGVKYYGKIGATDAGGNASGLNLTLPVTLDADNVLKIFVEQINADNLTDYASNPVTVTTTAPAASSSGPIIPIIKINEKPLSDYEEKDSGFVTLLYNRVLDRAPDATGLDGWVGALESGALTRMDLVNKFIFSDECQNTISDYTNEQFIEFLYQALFNRGPDSDGLNNWLTLMSAGMTKEEVVNCFTNCLEFGNLYL